MVGMDPEAVRTADMDPELEAFIALFSPADLTDPPSARKHLASWPPRPRPRTPPAWRASC
jgi:hypothetical protein